MEKDLYWELFYDTGDPVAWLLHRRVKGGAGTQERRTAEKKQAGRRAPGPSA